MAAKHARHDMREDKNFKGTDPSETTAQYLYCASVLVIDLYNYADFMLTGLVTLSSTNISGGAARHEKVSPKTWRILVFADAIWFLSLQVFTTDQPRSRAFKKTFAPLAFAKKFMAWLFSGKNQR